MILMLKYFLLDVLEIGIISLIAEVISSSFNSSLLSFLKRIKDFRIVFFTISWISAPVKSLVLDTAKSSKSELISLLYLEK